MLPSSSGNLITFTVRVLTFQIEVLEEHSCTVGKLPKVY